MQYENWKNVFEIIYFESLRIAASARGIFPAAPEFVFPKILVHAY